MGDTSNWYYAVAYSHLAICLLLAVYGMHRCGLVYLYYKHRRNQPRKTSCFLKRPFVTIQLPMYNEQYVARRVIEKACEIDYPLDRLEIQVLDDSTDESVEVVRETVARMQAAGHPVQLLHRTNRTGYKAGALDEGMKIAKGEFIVIFDADFLPPSDILDHLIDHFVDPKVGMVQARWEHLNREHSLLTKTQAILLDGHFVIEHAARNRSGRFMSFNGTAGAWRKVCIDDAGGWQHDTLTEDLDLSYRAQMKGWKFVFLPEVTSPAELPPDMNAFKSQQHRWAKGGAQTCRKLLPKILKSRLPWRIKLEAFFHLTNFVSYFLILLLTLMLFPTLALRATVFKDNMLVKGVVDGSLVLLATFSASSFYIASQREIFRTWMDSIKFLPFLMSIGVGISLNNARAAIEGFFATHSEFVRTPKYGVDGNADRCWKDRRTQFTLDFKSCQAWLELLMAVYLAMCLVYSVYHKMWSPGLFFISLFTAGFAYVAALTLYGQYRTGRAPDAEVAVLEDPNRVVEVVR